MTGAGKRRMTPAEAKQPPESDAYPVGLSNAFLFALFNALSFQMVLGSPMILYARSLGASSTVLGIVAGMMPLLVILQIPAAQHVARVGYKRFVFSGWGLRVMFIFVMALVPLTGRFLDATNRLALVLMVLFAFNLSRGISSAAWLPWITELVPVRIRGKYLAGDAAFANLGSFLAFLLAALCLGNHPSSVRFSAVFFFSALMGAASLFFLKRIPDVPTGFSESKSRTPVPWRAIAGHPPFQKLLAFNIGWAIAFGGMTTFAVVFLKAKAGLTERDILIANSAYFLGGLSSLWLVGGRLDRFGSKPVITFGLFVWLVILGGWLALAGGWHTPGRIDAFVLQFLMGLAAVLITMANTRLAMAIVPAMGRSHFFALFSVVGSLTLGISPVLWGLLIDALHGLRFNWHGFEWNQFSAFFAAAAGVFLLTLALGRRLHEPSAARMEVLFREMLFEPSQRLWLRLWPRE